MIGIPLGPHGEETTKRKHISYHWICSLCDFKAFDAKDREDHFRDKIEDGPHIELMLKTFWKL